MYQRATKECSLEFMRPELAEAIRAHLERFQLEGITDDVLISCETTSTTGRKGLLAKKSETTLGAVILTPKWLIWAGGKENEKAGVLSARLQDLRVQDYESTGMYERVQDSGVNVDGFRTGQERSTGSVFIGLGPEPAARRFRELLREAIARV